LRERDDPDGARGGAADFATRTRAMAEEPKIAEEMRRMEYEELLPVEKKLVAWSLILGIALLGALIWVSYRFFPGQ
jgi:hypothetical protein